MMRLRVAKPKCGRPDLNLVDPSFFLMCGSVDLLRIYCNECEKQLSSLRFWFSRLTF
jgi:hypothetical protein